MAKGDCDPSLHASMCPCVLQAISDLRTQLKVLQAEVRRLQSPLDEEPPESLSITTPRLSKIGIGDSSMKHANEGIRLGLGSNELSVDAGGGSEALDPTSDVAYTSCFLDPEGHGGRIRIEKISVQRPICSVCHHVLSEDCHSWEHLAERNSEHFVKLNLMGWSHRICRDPHHQFAVKAEKRGVSYFLCEQISNGRLCGRIVSPDKPVTVVESPEMDLQIEQIGVLTKAATGKTGLPFYLGLYYLKNSTITPDPALSSYVVALPHPCSYNEVIQSNVKNVRLQWQASAVYLISGWTSCILLVPSDIAEGMLKESRDRRFGHYIESGADQLVALDIQHMLHERGYAICAGRTDGCAVAISYKKLAPKWTVLAEEAGVTVEWAVCYNTKQQERPQLLCEGPTLVSPPAHSCPTGYSPPPRLFPPLSARMRERYTPFQILLHVQSPVARGAVPPLRFNSAEDRLCWVQSQMALSESDSQLRTIASLLRMKIAEVRAATFLNLSAKKLSVAPEGIFCLKNLTKLWLANNHLIDLPSSIGRLLHLEELNIGQNLITSLPKEMRELSHLEVLNVSGNPIEDISVVSELPRLAFLDLGECNIGDLESAGRSVLQPLTGMTSLQELSLLQNHLCAVPNEVYSFSNLVTLNLRDNNISQLSSNIRKLERLEVLHLSKNPIAHFDELSEGMPSLAKVYIGRTRVWADHYGDVHFRLIPV